LSEADSDWLRLVESGWGRLRLPEAGWGTLRLTDCQRWAEAGRGWQGLAETG